MSVGKDTVYNLAAALAPAALLLLVTPFYLDAIGPDRFGVLAICWTIIAALGFASLGMGPALTYHLASVPAANTQRRASLAWTALLLGFIASVGGAMLVVGVGEFYFRFFFPAASSLSGEIRQALPLLATLMPLAVINGIFNGALQGARRFGAMSSISVFRSALLAVAPLATAYLVSVDLSSLILANVATNALIIVVQFAACSKTVPLGIPRWPKRSDAKDLFGYGAWMSGTALIAPVVMLLDRFVIGALRGPTAVAMYVLPYNLVQQLVFLPASLTTAVLPRLVPLPDEELQELQSSSLAWLNGVLTPLSVVAIALAGPFFYLWIGPTLGKIAAPVAAILLVGGWVHGIGHVPSTLLLGRNRPDVITKLLLVYLAPYVAILYFATSRFGVIGAATAWTFRAAFDPILFLFTRPRQSDIGRVAISAALVLCSMTTALTLAWNSFTYMTAMSLIIAAALYQNRTVLIWSMNAFRKLTFQVSRSA